MVIEFFIFAAGLAVGSFLNVCITRLPEEKSVLTPRSHCQSCLKPIRWRHNIPLWSYLRLGGRCPDCGARFSVRYFLVELMTALFWVSVWAVTGEAGSFAVGAVFVSVLLAVSVTDLETGFIPDALTFSGAAAAVGASALFPALHHQTVWFYGLFESLLGLAGGYALLYMTGRLGEMIFHKESMGGGDMKLLAMIGAVLGIQKIFMVYFLAAVLALPFGLFVKWFRKVETIPFGPFLALAAVILYFWDRLPL